MYFSMLGKWILDFGSLAEVRKSRLFLLPCPLLTQSMTSRRMLAVDFRKALPEMCAVAAIVFPPTTQSIQVFHLRQRGINS